MKIRFQRGSVRFRLRQREVRMLVEEGRVVEEIQLDNALLRQILETGDAPPSVEIDGATVRARIPVADTRAWQSGDEAGLYYNLPGGTRLMVEKDWACIELPPGESNEDTFARPEQDTGGCGPGGAVED